MADYHKASTPLTVNLFNKPFPFALFLSCLLLTGCIESAFAQTPLQGGVQAQHHVLDEHGIVGLDLRITPGEYPLVMMVFPFSPAEKAGLEVGDRVLSVDGADLLNLNRESVDIAISDVPGTWIDMVVMHRGRRKNLRLQVQSIHELSPGLQSYYGP